MKKFKLPMAVLLIYIIISLARPALVREAIDNSVYYLVEMVQVMPFIFAAMVIIDMFVPKKLIEKGIGEHSGITGTLISFLLGSLSAGPIYAAFPVCKTLLKKGAGVANIVVILSAWAVIKVPMLINEMKFLGPTFMIARWGLTVIAIIVIGYVTSTAVSRDEIMQYMEVDWAFVINDEKCVRCGKCTKGALADYVKQCPVDAIEPVSEIS